MNRVFALLFLVVILMIGFGFYRGWFTLSTSERSEDNRKTDVNLTVDGDKMQEDFEKVMPSETINEDTEGAHKLGDPVNNNE